jgi:hypothetical protein
MAMDSVRDTQLPLYLACKGCFSSDPLANYIVGKRAEIDFSTPSPFLSRDTSEAVRERILSMSVAEAKQLGIRKNTLWYMQQRARSGRPLTIYRQVRKKLA